MALDTPLNPFIKPGGSGPFTTNDCINIETQLGYPYGPGSLDQFAKPRMRRSVAAADAAEPERTVHVGGIDRAKIRGSFLIAAFADVDGKRQHIGTEAVLSRWHVEGCMNCQNHLEATAAFRLPADAAASLKATAGDAAGDSVEVEVRTRQGLFGGGRKARSGKLDRRRREPQRHFSRSKSFQGFGESGATSSGAAIFPRLFSLP